MSNTKLLQWTTGLMLLALLLAGCGNEPQVVATHESEAPSTQVQADTPILPTFTPVPPTSTPIPPSTTPSSVPPTLTPTLPSPTSTPTKPPTPTPIPEASVATESLNLRGGPGTIYPIVGRVSGGDTLFVLARNKDGSWLEVETPDGEHAWVSADFMEMSMQPDSIPVAVEIPPTPERAIPKVGHWHGSDPSVGFSVGADGNIHDFEMVAPFGGSLSTCTVRVKEIAIDRNGTFSLTIPLIENIENRITGELETANSLTGTYLLKFCTGEDGSVSITLTFGEQDPIENWTAEWRGP